MQPTLYIFVGYPGAGKTTVAQWICSTTGAYHIWTDQERHAMFPQPTHSQLESNQLYAHLNKKTEQLLEDGESVVFDTNFNFKKDRDYLRQIAQRAGAQTKLIWLTTDKTIAKQRALHDDHAERNGYESHMDAPTFERIADHLEEPTLDEHALQFNGVDLQKQTVLAALNIA